MDGYVWGASVVEVILTQFIKLWDLQKKQEVNGKTAQQQ